MKINLKRILSMAVITTMLSSTFLIIASPVNAQEPKELTSNVLKSDSVSFTEYGADMECVFASWSHVSNANDYAAYLVDYTGTEHKLNDNLIRKYEDYYRVDAIGIPVGTYKIKIVPKINNVEDLTKAALTSELMAVSYDRCGFSFSSESPTRKLGSETENYTGGYSNDATIPSNAQILYITDNNKDTVTLDVINNSNGEKVACTGLGTIFATRAEGYDKTPLIVRFVGTVKEPSGVNSKKYLHIKNCSNITFEGVGSDALLLGWSFLVEGSSNIEIRNLGLMWFGDDGISFSKGNTGIWVHNNDIFYGERGADDDQVKGDGSIDVKGGSTFVTCSYNHFWDSGKSSLCGMTESKEFFVTYHHNWFDHSDSRHPRIRVGTIHVYNNYYDGVAKYGVGSTTGSSVFVEKNYFRNCNYPILISMQGSDCFDSETQSYDYTDKPTFSKEPGGMIKAFDNYMEGQIRYVNQNTVSGDLTQIDAYEVTSRNETVPSSIVSRSGDTPYNNFDTALTMYSYNSDSPEIAKDKVITYAGRVQGGDFKWTFDNSVDDRSASINEALYSALRAYVPKVILEGVPANDDSEPRDIAVSETATTDFLMTENCNRADFMVMMINALNITGTAKNNFEDVKSDKHYANAIGLAKEFGIARGIGNNNFNPDATITKQDAICVIARALANHNVELNTNNTILDKFDDAGMISDYAAESVSALLNLGIVNGSGSKIEPLKLLTKAELNNIMAKVNEIL